MLGPWCWRYSKRPAYSLLPPRSDSWAAIAVAMYTGAVLLFLASIEAAQSNRLRLQPSFIDHPAIGPGGQQLIFACNLNY
jgi:hypothetical protein